MKKLLICLAFGFASSICNAQILKVVIPADEAIQTSSKTISPYRLKGKEWGTPTRQEKIWLREDGNILKVHRRTDNGVAGSGAIYKFTLKNEMHGDTRVLIFEDDGLAAETYQEGLFGKFKVPNFSHADVIEYLANGYILYNFEINSDYPAESVKANFKRLADSEVVAANTRVRFTYNVVPYRNGSKAVIEASIPSPAYVDGVVDFKPVVDSLKTELISVVND